MYQMTETEYKFAELIWEEEPIGSGELVKQCAEKFGWKKSTTYTFIKKLCENGIFKNENAIVSSVLNKEEYHRAQGEAFVEKAYGGSLPKEKIDSFETALTEKTAAAPEGQWVLLEE